MQTWKPKTGENAKHASALALEVAQRLQETLSQNGEEPRDPSLACGDAGLAVLYGYLDRCFPTDNWDRVAHKAVQRVTRSMNSSANPSIGFFGGLSGVAFVTWYLSREETRYNRARAAIEDALLAKAVRSAGVLRTKTGMAVEEYDLVSGLSGVAAYLLCRCTDNKAHGALVSILESLVEIIEHEGTRPAWYTPAELISAKDMHGKYPQGNLNCGLAHGLPGILSVLALALRQDLKVPGLHSAIKRSAHWLNAQRMPDRWGGSWPPAVPVGESSARFRAPLAWCYGNPGVARSLWLAGTAINDSCLCETAVEAICAISRRPRPEQGITSPTFCHGVAGLLQISMRFASETGVPELSQLADAFLQKLQECFSEDSLFGYRAYDSESGLVDRAGLLDGAAGVALVLLAAASDQEPSWDRIFLLS
jgi:lantibiotic modifying enzyme